MIRKRILLASLLKPVSDTRLYEKIGQSLAKLPEVEVHLAGFKAHFSKSAAKQAITFHPIFSFRRLSFGRIAAQLTFWKLLRQVRPQLLLVATHELLPLSWLYSKLYSCPLVYDVQENYYLNLTTQSVYPGVLGKVLGFLVRALEKAAASSVSHFLLAETSYAQELPFLGQRYTVLQNKYLPPAASFSSERSFPISLEAFRPLRLLYSGTISRLYGVLEAIEFTRQLRTWRPEAELTIIGYCAEEAFLRELKSLVKDLPYVQLIGGETLVPHEEILVQERLHHVGLLPYRPHPSTFSCVPTKLFEYLGNGLVVITEANPLWADILDKTQAGFTIRFSERLSLKDVEVLLKNTYYPEGIPAAVFWQEEEQKVQTIIRDLLKL
ncbi:glycosyltransferase [Rufibacter sediminis]|uniref:Glycosyltransferase n=1 Tax=Rufibacter sediminis TaxID=2762756 RepID=A0ABR6VRM7_9BACT|nr:glycosyltransferase [Rufibacter sediminis]MBC3539801.1 glycosyltransferase [Rufibacter sediminis]